jgi:hypothetical protein
MTARGLSDKELVQLIEHPDMERIVRKWGRKFPAHTDEFRQEGALAIIQYAETIAARPDPVRSARFVVWRAVILYLRREFQIPQRNDGSGKKPLRRTPRRRSCKAVYYRIPSREAGPAFLAALREELGPDLATPEHARPKQGFQARMTRAQEAILRDLLLGLVGEIGWSRDAIVAEFRRRSNRLVHPDTISRFCQKENIPVPWSDFKQRRAEKAKKHHQFAVARVY